MDLDIGKDYSGDELEDLGYEIAFIKDKEYTEKYPRAYHVVNRDLEKAYLVHDVGNNWFNVEKKVDYN